MRFRIRAALLAAALIGQGAIALPAAADEHPRVETIATGLNNPRGIDVDTDGTVYVAEAGVGGDEHCVTVGEGDEEAELCFGTTSGVTAISTDGTAEEVVSGLPSFMAGEGEFLGASDVTVADDGELLLTIGLGGDSDLRDAVAADFDPAGMLGTLQLYDGDLLTEIADLAQWEADNDPDEGHPSTQGPQGQPSNDSNPNAVLLTSDGDVYVVDAGGNSLLHVDLETSDISLRAVFDDRFADAPPFLQLPPGTQIPMQSVPTNVVEAPGGDLVVSELTGFPFPVGGAQLYSLSDDDDPEVLAEGFTNVMDVAYLGGELYVLELSHTGLLGGIEGSLVRVRADGTRTALLRDVLVAPGGMAVGPDGMLYITNVSVGEPGSGSVLRFDPSMAADPAIQSACPPLAVAGTALTDVAGTTHEESITCALWHGLFAGMGDGTFAPNAHITRGQFATTVANLVRATGAELPVGQSGQFSDVDGSTHAASINDLAAADLVSGFAGGEYRPQANVSRAQAVSVLAAAYAYVVEADLPAGPDAFDDVGGVHEANINAAAAMGWVLGTGEGTFSPGADIRRGQMASTLARVASDLVDGGHLSLPS